MSSPVDYNERFKDFALNQVVLTRYNNKTYRIDDIAWNTNPMSVFQWRDQEVMCEYKKNMS